MTNRGSSRLHAAVLVTGNRNKLEEARRLVGHELQAVGLDLPEIQSLDMREVLRSKALAAHHSLQQPVIVDETGLELTALNGFPGCLVKWMLQAIGAAGIARTAAALDDVRATARCGLLYFDGGSEVLAEGKVDGSLVPPRGDEGFGWDPIFLPATGTRTFAELSGAEKDAVSHRGAAWRRLRQLLAER